MISLDAFVGPVDERIENHKVTRGHFLLQGATSCGSQNMGNTEVLQGQNVGSVVDFGRVELVRGAMPEISYP